MLWFRRHGLEARVSAAVLRMQLLVSVVFKYREASMPLPPRSTGTLTGTRVAGLLGQAPILDMFFALSATWERDAFALDGTGACTAMATWIDNLYSFSSSPSGAVRIQEAAASFLSTH